MAQRLSSAEMVTSFIDERMSRETPAQQALRAETRKLSGAGMMSRPEADALLQLLIKLTAPSACIEVGTFTGIGLAGHGAGAAGGWRIVACDVSAEWTAIGRKHWQQAGVAHKIDLRLAPAGDTIAALLKDGAAGTYDMAFVDADKTGYDTYYEGCLKLLRQGGLMCWTTCCGAATSPTRTSTTRTPTPCARSILKIKDDNRWILPAVRGRRDPAGTQALIWMEAGDGYEQKVASTTRTARC
jgi:predicted O-methyltransferase YrrM